MSHQKRSYREPSRSYQSSGHYEPRRAPRQVYNDQPKDKSMSPPRRRPAPSSFTRGSSRSPPRRNKKIRSGWDQTPDAVQMLSGFDNIVPVHADRISGSDISSRTNSHPLSSKHSQRLYLGNLPPDSVEKDLLDFLNEAMKIALVRPRPGDSVTTIFIKHDKHFGFAEFRSSAEASAGLALDGIEFNGNLLHIRRPSDYTQSSARPERVPEMDLAKLDLISTNVPDDSTRIYIGYLPLMLPEQPLQKLLQCFGKLKTFQLVRDISTNASCGYAFCAFADYVKLDDVCDGLNGIQIANHTIAVYKAADIKEYLKHHQLHTASASDILKALKEAKAEPPSKTICLMQMVLREELLDEQEYTEILEDIREECSQYGEIMQLIIPRPIANSNLPVPGEGKVYIEFDSIESATKAIEALQGRKFIERTILAQFYNKPIPQ